MSQLLKEYRVLADELLDMKFSSRDDGSRKDHCESVFGSIYEIMSQMTGEELEEIKAPVLQDGVVPVRVDLLVSAWKHGVDAAQKMAEEESDTESEPEEESEADPEGGSGSEGSDEADPQDGEEPDSEG